MIKEVIIYGLSTAILRGSSLLYLPLLITILTLDKFGIYSLIQTGTQLLVPLISLGGSAAILREGSEDYEFGFQYFIKFSQIALILGISFTILCFFLDKTETYWLTFTVVIATLEALQLLLLTWTRCLNRSGHYLAFSFFKALGIFVVILVVKYLNWSLVAILLGQISWSIIITMVELAILSSWRQNVKTTCATVISVLPYTIPLIPHSISQWVISSSDRFIIKILLGDEEVGIYNIAYTLSMVIMIINSGIALALPQYVVQNYDEWLFGTVKRKFILIYSILVLLFVLLLNKLIKFNEYFLILLPMPYSSIGSLSKVISLGLYLLGIYYFYGSIIFYHKRTDIITKQTIIASSINIIITIIFVFKMGVMGAALATAISYLVYLVLVVRSVVKIEVKLRKKIHWEAGLVILTTLTIMAI